ncbi:MAG TPA: CHASE2 domain-containing protein [Verrucomicrobiae bacterium]|jgi:CHASE2 domain-containing sensor protein
MGKFFTQKTIQPAFGAALAVFCGWVLWSAPPGDPWVNSSYDYLFRFGARPITNDVVLVLMDNEAYDHFHQTRGQPWDRGLHAQLLNKLADDGCSLVVIDSFFGTLRDAPKDQALASAMHRQRHIVLMAEQARMTAPGMTGARPVLPASLFLDAAGTNWGVAWLDSDLDSIVRRHWPFPSPSLYPSLPWTAATLCGAKPDDRPQKRWLRYYGRNGDWPTMSYQFALEQPANYFRDKIVFVGTAPQTSQPDGEPDEFRSPYWLWTHESSGGVEIMLTSYLNLLNGDWLRRPPGWLEFSILTVVGISLGGLCRMHLFTASTIAVSAAILVSLGAITLSYFTDYWFPWLVIAGGQIPCALGWAAIVHLRSEKTRPIVEKPPGAPGYKLIHPPFGEGAYGKVWLAKNADGQWRALKVIYLKNFENNASPYEREFNGVSRYQPFSTRHPGLLRVDFVSKKLDGYFYYVMELGDSIGSDWQREPQKYQPRDLANERKRHPSNRLPLPDCVRIGLDLSDVLEFLHQQGLTHRDIKPQNVIFVDGRPKLADLGLVAEIRLPDETKTFVGTPGYLPPPPEFPGTPQADVYALGMLLYVISTGRSTAAFPELSATLLDSNVSDDFLALNTIILKACEPDLAYRYKSAREMHQALEKLRK